MFEAEFGVFYHLDFALHCQLYEVSHHFSRLLKMIEAVPKDYLGRDLGASMAQGSRVHASLRCTTSCTFSHTMSIRAAKPCNYPITYVMSH